MWESIRGLPPGALRRPSVVSEIVPDSADLSAPPGAEPSSPGTAGTISMVNLKYMKYFRA